MIKKTIKYTNYNGVECTEDFYFNLSRAELIQMEFGTKEGFTKKIEKISKSEDSSQIFNMFSDIVLKAYGKKSEDGTYFRKSEQLSEEFSQSEAYSELLVELMSDENKASDFVKGLINAGGTANVDALPDPKSISMK